MHSILEVSTVSLQDYQSMLADISLGVPSQLRRHLSPEALQQAMEIAQRLQRITPRRVCRAVISARINVSVRVYIREEQILRQEYTL